MLRQLDSGEHNNGKEKLEYFCKGGSDRLRYERDAIHCQFDVDFCYRSSEEKGREE